MARHLEPAQAQSPLAAEKLRAILSESSLSKAELAQHLGASLVSVVRWERGDRRPSTDMARRIDALLEQVRHGSVRHVDDVHLEHTFASRGVRKTLTALPLFSQTVRMDLHPRPGEPLLCRIKNGGFWQDGEAALGTLLQQYDRPSPTVGSPSIINISAGKNTYTYDAHTYHTKVPPQGIAEIIRQYLPEGGLVLDPFAGSGMTGVAALAVGYDAVLNELSPAASFIANRFTSRIEPALFSASVRAVCNELKPLRDALYTTECRKCGKASEILFTVWSYRVQCYLCGHEMLLWDHCRQYGRVVREHKILSEFACPGCKKQIKKARLARTVAEPVLLGYKCCSRSQVESPLTEADLKRLRDIEMKPPVAEGFYPTTTLPDGVNLRQPKRHGLLSIDRFYTPRNLAAMSHLWRTLHRVGNTEAAAFLGFVFTSLYKRVTRLSEFRFWGGSGNTANFNVPFIFNEANVFVTFERKARTIQDHLETTARRYRGQCVVRTGSATDLSFLPDNSVDLVFTDPPFGANINYSEMNIIWEAWLGDFTDTSEEVIINKYQKKGVGDYERLMRGSLSECCRVLRPGHWLILVFMNSSKKVWQALRRALIDSGFALEHIDMFDKQHGTFKQFVSENTTGCDLLLHCRKPLQGQVRQERLRAEAPRASISRFLSAQKGHIPKAPYLHVRRADEVDYRMLYSQWLADGLLHGNDLIDFVSFREFAEACLQNNKV